MQWLKYFIVHRRSRAQRLKDFSSKNTESRFCHLFLRRMAVDKNTLVAVHYILSDLLRIPINKKLFVRRIGQVAAAATCHENELILAIILLLRALQSNAHITEKNIYYQYFVAITLANSYLYDAQLSLSQWAQSCWVTVEPSKIFGAQLLFLSDVDWDLCVSEADYMEIALCIDLLCEVYA